MGDIEAQLRALESRFNAIPVSALETRLAGVEQSQWQQWDQGGGAAAAASNPVLRAAKTGAGGIPAKAGGACGSATVTLYEIDPVSGSPTAGPTVTAWNWFPTAVGASKEIYVGWHVNSNGTGLWVVPSEYCA